jgi:hypothetical protein
MLKPITSTGQMETAVGKLAERSVASFPTAAGDRSFKPRSNKTVEKLDRRRFHEISPNSRKSRRGAGRRASSHSQGRDIVMDVFDRPHSEFASCGQPAALEVMLAGRRGSAVITVRLHRRPIFKP